MSATQPESDDNPNYGFTQELLIGSEKQRKDLQGDMDDLEANDGTLHTPRTFKTPRLNRKESIANTYSSPMKAIGKFFGLDESQAEVPVAVREFFEMFEEDDDSESYPQWLRDLEGPFSPV